MTEWEKAYLEFESPAEEVSKFKKRLIKLGALTWNRESKILELFCGRGGGLKAWEQLGYHHLSGLDLSERLIQKYYEEYSGKAHCVVGDARALPFADGGFDIVSIHGGLHHLTSQEDIRQVLREIHRVLQPEGTLVLVEPWMTPFLSWVHWACRSRLMRRLSGKLNALATMINCERIEYFAWLEHPREIREILEFYLTPIQSSRRLGKLRFLGRRRKLI
jgi:ubiquinone/menaquinone biosynthesis C-methylase UbiE